MRRWISLTLLATLNLLERVAGFAFPFCPGSRAGSRFALRNTRHACCVTSGDRFTRGEFSGNHPFRGSVLENPRGFTWDSDGTMYVATAGTGGSVQFSSATSDDATPIPDFAGTTASVVRIVQRDDVVTIGCPVVVASGLPSTRGMNGHDQGPADVAFLGGQLYVLQDGGDSAVLFPDFPNGIYLVNSNGTLTLIADIRKLDSNATRSRVWPTTRPEGETFAMIAGNSFLLGDRIDRGQVLKVTPDGQISRVADLSEGHPVPTAAAPAADGGIYVSS